MWQRRSVCGGQSQETSMARHCEQHFDVLTLSGVGYVSFAMSTAMGVTIKSRNWSLEGFPGT